MTATPLLDAIAEHGNSGPSSEPTQPNRITCADGFSLSVIAGRGYRCGPRPGRDCEAGVLGGSYAAVEVGCPSEQPAPWRIWSAYAARPETPTQTVYGWVPVRVVRGLLVAHGGEAL